ncbi:MAG: hypothetical protein ACI93N_002576 [Flavobacteriaceae bacterium]|jgi:hypothetical protein
MIENLGQINIYDLIGNKVYSEPINEIKTNIDVTSFSKGIYNIVITNNKDINISNKIIVK